LIEEARRLYTNNQFSLDVIDEFEREYQSKDAIKWYTRDSFVYRSVNLALRSQNPDIIYKYRFFLSMI